MKWILPLAPLLALCFALCSFANAAPPRSDLAASWETVVPNAGYALDAAGPAAWSGRPGTDAWTASVAGIVAQNLARLERAQDVESFCPGYAAANQARRITCWVRLVSAIVQYESDFDPTSSFKEANGTYSVGLLQLSIGDCGEDDSVPALQDASRNLICGTQKMAALIEQYGFVTSPDNLHGAAAYWSSLRAPYISGQYHLGKKNEIAQIAAEYGAVAPVGQ